MKNKPLISASAPFYVLKPLGTKWRVEHLLADNVHVRLANIAEPRELKSVSTAALRDGPFARIEHSASDDAQSLADHGLTNKIA